MNRKSFDQSWEEIHAKCIWGGYPSEHVIRFVARNFYGIQNRDSVRILDFGCGAGAHTWYLVREGFGTYAFDGSQNAVNNTIARLKTECVEYDTNHVICADGLNLPYKNNYFHAIIDNVSIQANLYKDIYQMYRNCYQMLKSEGKLFTCVFGKETDGYGTGKEIESGTYENLTEGRLQHSGKKHFFDKEELRDLLLDCGFQDIQIDSVRYTDGGDKVHQWIAITKK